MWESTLSLCNNVSVLCFFWFLGFVVRIWEYYKLEVEPLCLGYSISIPRSVYYCLIKWFHQSCTNCLTGYIKYYSIINTVLTWLTMKWEHNRIVEFVSLVSCRVCVYC